MNAPGVKATYMARSQTPCLSHFISNFANSEYLMVCTHPVERHSHASAIFDDGLVMGKNRTLIACFDYPGFMPGVCVACGNFPFD